MKAHINKLLGLIIFSFCIVAMSGCKDDEGTANVEITDISVTSAYPLDNVTIHGNGLSAVNFVFVGNRQATFEVDGNALTLQIPSNAAAGENEIILVMNGGNRAKVGIQITLRPVPIIERITPSAVPVGGEVTILGSALNNLVSATIGDVEAETVSESSEKLVLKVPNGLPDNLPAIIKLVGSAGETSSTSIFYIGENMIENGDFESGSGEDFDPWYKANNSHDGLKLADPADSYAGRTLLAVSGHASQQWVPQMFSNPTGTVAGNTYTLLLWIKGAAGTPGDGGRIRFSTTPSPMYSGNYDITSEWQQITWEFEANVDNMQIVLDLGGVEDAVYHIDNVTLISTGDAAPQPVELLLNGGFELGDGDEFTNWSKFNGAELLTATTNEGEVRSGNRALKAVGAGPNEWSTQFASDVMETIEGREYVASFWIKGEAGSPGDGGVVRMSTAGNGSAQYQGSVTVTTEWQNVEWTFTANGTETQIVLDLGKTENAVYFIDDASFLQMPESE